jgi:hypothetical protein
MAERKFTDGKVYSGEDWLADVATISFDLDKKAGKFILNKGDLAVATAVVDEMSSDVELPDTVVLEATDNITKERVRLKGLMVWTVPIGFTPVDILGKSIIFSYSDLEEIEESD